MQVINLSRISLILLAVKLMSIRYSEIVHQVPQQEVFDNDTAPILAASACRLTAKRATVSEVINKPLPPEPPIELAPLSVRQRRLPPSKACLHPTSDHADQAHTTREARLATQRCSSEPTISQAAEELEDALAEITRQSQNDTQLFSADISDGPLQISRGNMDMIATRPAPRPPTTGITSITSYGRLCHNNIHQSSVRDAGKVMKSIKNKGAFSIAVPRFGGKFTKHYFGSPSLKSELEPQSFQPQRQPPPEAIHDEVKEDVIKIAKPSHSPSRSRGGKPLFLKSKLPRFQAEQTCSHEHLISTPSSVENKSVVERPLPGIQMNNIEESTTVLSNKLAPLNTSVSLYELDGGVSQGIGSYEPDADLPSAEPEITTPIHKHCERATGLLPDEVACKIMEQVSSLKNLFNLAVVSKQYYCVFKKHELRLTKTTVFRMSPPAWELREMSPPWDSEWEILHDPESPVPEYTPALYLQRYGQDIYTLARLKVLILLHCNNFLRRQTINGLTGKDDTRAGEIDDAFWRIWTFCRIFGCGKNGESDIVGQVDWLNGGAMANNRSNIITLPLAEPYGINNVLLEPPEGFGHGNGGGLSQSQLYDMIEVWTCLAVLLQPIHGRRTEARKAGIFDGLDVAENDMVKEEAMIEEWTYYVLTMGPSAVLYISSIYRFDSAEVDNPEATDQMAQLTKWKLSKSGTSRSTFLKEAICRAYKILEGSPKLNAPLPLHDNSTSSRSFADHRIISQVRSNMTNTSKSNRNQQALYTSPLQNHDQARNDRHSLVRFAEESPISSHATMMRCREGLSSKQSSPPPGQSVSGPQTPWYYPPGLGQCSQRPPSTLPPAHPVLYTAQVLDPVDQAIYMMVNELGFKEEDVKWALKVTDNGQCIDADAAVALLTKKYKQWHSSRFTFRLRSSSLLQSIINSRQSVNSAWKWS